MPEATKISIAEWWKYEASVFLAACHETSRASFGRGFVVSVVALIGQGVAGLRNGHDTLLMVLISLGAGVLVFLVEFAFKLFRAPAKMAKEAAEKLNSQKISFGSERQKLLDQHETDKRLHGEEKERLEKIIESLRAKPASMLEIEGIPCEIKRSGNSGTVCQILVHNKHPNIQARNVAVTLLEMEGSPENKPTSSQIFPLILKPEVDGEKSINADDELKFTLFYVEPSDPKIVACFQPGGNRDKRWLLFDANTSYHVKIKVTADPFSPTETEFNLNFIREGSDLRFTLTKINAVPQQEKTAAELLKAEKAVEKLTGFSTVFFQRLNAIRTIPAAQYNPNKDDELWKNNDAAIAYIVLNLNAAAGKLYDDGVAEITPLSVRKPGVGSTRYEDDQNVVLARTHRRIVNLKRIIEGIDKYLKPPK